MQNPHIDKADAHYPDVTGILLAGGQSRRMGRDKACIEFGGEMLFSRSLALLQRYFAKVMIAGDRPDLTRPEVPAIADIFPGSALGGLYTGLHAAQTEWIFVAPCDMPYPDGRLLELLLGQRKGVDAVVPRTPDGYEPVFAAYHRNCLPLMEEMLRNNQHRIYDFYQRIAIRYLDWPQMPEGWERALLNLNHPEQLARIRKEKR
jgi:molybdopterin-guanine dinucleotide biosynthesis protein A